MTDRSDGQATDPSSRWVRRVHWLLAALILLIAIGLRIALYRGFPIILTADAADYLSAVREIRSELDFKGYGLRDWRLPGYPVFLALTTPLTSNGEDPRIQSNRLILLQNGLGIVCVLLGLVIGRLLDSRFTGTILALFLAVNPVYLLNEHLVLTETLYLFSLLVFTVAALHTLRGQWNWITGAVLGLSLGVSTLTRANGLPFMVVMLAGIGLAASSTLAGSRLGNPARRQLGVFIVVAGISAALLLVPWLWRNYRLFGNISLVNMTQRNRMLVKKLYGNLDESLPLIKSKLQEWDLDEFDYPVLLRMQREYSTLEAEDLARQFFDEQIAYHPDLQRVDQIESLYCFGGFCDEPAGERIATLHWFDKIITFPVEIQKLNRQDYLKTGTVDFVLIETSLDQDLVVKWKQAGVYYLTVFRPWLYALFFVCAGLWLLYGFYRLVFRKRSETLTTETRRALRMAFDSFSVVTKGYALALFFTGYLAIVAVHTVLLSIDRYAFPFDWIPLVCVLLTIEFFAFMIWKRLASTRIPAK